MIPLRGSRSSAWWFQNLCLYARQELTQHGKLLQAITSPLFSFGTCRGMANKFPYSQILNTFHVPWYTQLSSIATHMPWRSYKLKRCYRNNIFCSIRTHNELGLLDSSKFSNKLLRGKDKQFSSIIYFMKHDMCALRRPKCRATHPMSKLFLSMKRLQYTGVSYATIKVLLLGMRVLFSLHAFCNHCIE